MSLSSQIPGIETYSVDDRLWLIEEFWDSIPDDFGQLKVSQEHKDELDRRLSAMEIDPLGVSSWEEVKARLQGRSGDGS